MSSQPVLPAGHRVQLYDESSAWQLGTQAAEIFLATVKANPATTILLPTGSTPVKMYKRIVALFKQDATIDLSQTNFFNLDEYENLPKTHALSYYYFMQTHFYGPLREVSAERCPQPEKSHFLTAQFPEETPEQVLVRFKAELESAPPVELAILGIGGAFVDTDKKISGAHIAFNEPYTKPDQECHIVELTVKTRRDTKHRFTSLQLTLGNNAADAKVPERALTIGLAEILGAKHILMLAMGEDKEPSVRLAFLDNHGQPSARFPASQLLVHGNVTWLVDEFAGKVFNQRPWLLSEVSVAQPPSSEQQTAWLYKALTSSALQSQKSVAEVTLEDITTAGLTQVYIPTVDFKTVQAQLLVDLQRDVNPTPTGQNVLILSPHPDDDVISMGATLAKLVAADSNNTVHVVYGCSGSNAVRATFPAYESQLQALAAATPDLDVQSESASRLAKTLVREAEATAAVKVLGISDEKNLHFLRSDFYTRRGIPRVEAITAEDRAKVKALLQQIRPTYVYFAAEADPHGAHGLSATLIAKGLEEYLADATTTEEEKQILVFGYRGAWNEWSVDNQPHQLQFMSFSETESKVKTESILQHASQLNPVFPGFDTREFFERAQARNQRVCTDFKTLVGAQSLPSADVGMEVFKRYSVAEYIESYA